MQSTDFQEDPDRVLDVLRTVAEQYEQDSFEKIAIEYAARAILFAYGEATTQRFREYLKDSGTELNPKQRDYLRSIGLET